MLYNSFMDKKKKVLIIGASAKEYALAKKFAQYDNVSEVVVAPGNSMIQEICTCVDIREENVQELLEYALENAVDLTIASSETAIKNDISGLFQANNQLIFAPSAQSANFAISKSAGKKFLYKLRIPTPRFGIYDKPQLAVDYLKSANLPVVIRTDESLSGRDRLVCTTFITAKTFTEDLFCRDEKKVIFEDYAYGHEFTFYVVTDGYQAIPLTSVANYKFMEDGDGGILTDGIGAFAPDYKISKDIEASVMKNVVNNILQALQKRETPYMGILGVDCVLNEDNKFVTLEFRPFLSDHDAQAVLNIVDENLLTLFEACAIGSFADDYECINMSDNSSVSCVLSARQSGKVISGLDLVESDITHFAAKKNEYMEYETVAGKTLVLTNTAKTLSRAKKHLYEDIEVINFEGKKCRTDICN